nr:glycosyltransferase family A protein [uncultured Gellertiella sp.]
MSVRPMLSICVPSRNRQLYFQQTIDALRRSLRTDIQFVFADNSDDPEIMNSFMKDVVADPRVVYLPSTGTTLSMVDNWERVAAAATGDFWTFIGDDDYVDPDLAAFLGRVLETTPELDALAWRIIGYTWPYPERPKMAALVPFDHTTVKIPQSDLYKRMFGWYDCRHVPTSGFSIYHSAISRKLMEKIRKQYGGRYFEHPIVDYDNAFKVICLGSTFAATARPFGIMGSCPLSNSFGVGKLKDFRKKMVLFAEEVGHDFDTDSEFRKFPFRNALGTTATIGIAQQWFKTTYNLIYENWGEGFARACANDCMAYSDRESFDLAVEGYGKAFSLWEGGRYRQFFNPVFNEAVTDESRTVSCGFSDGGVYLDQNIAGVKTPAELFDIVRGMVIPLDLMELEPAGLKFPWETEDRVKKMLHG